MNLQNNNKKAFLLYEALIGLFILCGFTGVILNTWHGWYHQIKIERNTLNVQRVTLNDLRQQIE